MRGRTFLLIGISLGLGTVPLTCSPRGRCHSSYNLVPVVVAAVDLPAGTVVTYEMISQRSVPEQFITSSIVKPDSASSLVNERLQVAIQAGDPLRWVDFGARRTDLEPGSRVVSIDLEPSRALAGLLARGDHVDVLATATDPTTLERVAQTMVENAEVLDVAERTLTSVKLVVDAEAAERLLLAQEVGKLALTLRNPRDPAPGDLGRRTTLETLLRPAWFTACHYRPFSLLSARPK